jgi:alkylation response protein AidB-like acyl-CoA dehydrogenase
MSIALTADQKALAESVALLATRRASIADTRTAFEDLAAGRRHSSWQALVDQGLLGLHLPTSVGGDDAGVTELAVVLDEAAYGLIPGPLLPTVLSSLLISRHGVARLRDRMLPEFVSGQAGACATTTTGLTATIRDGGWVVSGVTAPILGALAADVVVLGAADGDGGIWFVVDGQMLNDVVRTPLRGVDLTRDVGRFTLDGFGVPPEAVLGVNTDQVRSFAATLFAAEAAGVARWCQEAGLAYVKVREQFGRTIASFQAIKHKCARLLVQSELVTASAWDAAIACDQDDDQLALASAAAAATSLPGAVDVAFDTVTLFGGIGYTWEHDTHLYWRRAITLQSLMGRRDEWKLRVGEYARLTHRRYRLQLDDEPESLRGWVAYCLAEAKAMDADKRRAYLVEQGLAAPHYPKPFGIAADAVTQVVISQEFERAGILPPSAGIGEWALPTIVAHGTDEQRERFGMATLRGEIAWCQLFSEPSAGSDLASLRTKAEKVDGGWLLNGQKVWTSNAKEADWGICLARTDPQAPKHLGISYFLVDMTSPGLDVRPLREANGGYLFNEVFFSDVFVPDSCVVGEPGDGWRLARTTLGNERVNIATVSGRQAEVPAAHLDAFGPAAPESTVAEAGSLSADALAFGALSQRSLIRQIAGMQPGAEASVLKVASGWNLANLRRAVLDWTGPEAAVHGLEGDPAQALLSVPPSLIGGGTLEIQLNVIGELVLGLPRS